ncbi:unnamed protein product [Sphagnum jensenii]|uniref:Uncharacterized protein n=1 Tax=Sphagnum jensenii TaxID=128206 RepID=A0ABP1BLH4_9BRYO
MDCVVEGIIEAEVSFLSCYLLLLFGGWFVLDVYAWMRLPWCIVFAISLKWHGGFLEDVDQISHIEYNKLILLCPLVQSPGAIF